jgi:hypothetical protein
MTDALEQSQQAAWDAFIRRRQRKLAKLKHEGVPRSLLTLFKRIGHRSQLNEQSSHRLRTSSIWERHHQQHYEDKAPAGRDRERDHHRLQSVFQADEVESADSVQAHRSSFAAERAELASTEDQFHLGAATLGARCR